MSIEDFPQPYKELYAIHNHLIELGFLPDDIYVAVNNIANTTPPTMNVLCAHLRTQDKEFVFTIAPLGSDIITKEVYNKWTSFAIQLKESKDEDIKKVLRSEEHTSELQSRENLVCRLLLEKKK